MATIRENDRPRKLSWQQLLMQEEVLDELYQDIPMGIKNNTTICVVPGPEDMEAGDEYTYLSRMLANFATRPNDCPQHLFRPHYSRFRSHDLMALAEVPSLLLKEVTVWKASLRKDARMYVPLGHSLWRNRLAVLCAQTLATFHQFTMDKMVEEGIPDFTPHARLQQMDERMTWVRSTRDRSRYINDDGRVWNTKDHGGRRPWDPEPEESEEDSSDATLEDDEMHDVETLASVRSAEAQKSKPTLDTGKWLGARPYKS